MVTKFPKLHDRDWLQEAWQTKTTEQIAAELGCCHASVYLAMKRNGIETPRPPGSKPGPQELHDREWMEEKYKYLTTHEIAKLLGCSQRTVWGHMKSLGIQLNVDAKRRRKSKYKEKTGPSGRSQTEHRLIMADHLGRKLESHEHVHHIDGDTWNNALENLVVLHVKKHLSLHFQGENHPRARLTEADVREIRQRAEQGETKISLSRSFGVTRTHIYLIVHRKTWKHVT